jgi:DNA-binding winged helix-turn-helix (wHTH) protein
MNSAPESRQKISFGPFIYSLGQKQLFRGSEPVDLQPKTLETLHVLALHHGQVVEKADLIKAVWPDTVVEEIGLARNISQLRKALGEEAGSETYIQTIPRRGYRLVAEEACTGGPDRDQTNSRRRVLVLAAAVGIVSILLIYWQFYRPSRWLPDGQGRADVVVMPFQGEPSGFSDALAAQLSSYPHLRVISPATVRRYRYIRVPDHWTARILGVDVMIDGEWPAGGSALGGNARLTDVHSGRMIWSGRLEGQAASGAVGSIALSVSERLHPNR